jgi:hypothetical protein
MAVQQTNGKVEDEKIRVSITIDPALRRKMRIAAAHADMEVGEWAAEVLKAAAIKAVKA